MQAPILQQKTIYGGGLVGILGKDASLKECIFNGSISVNNIVSGGLLGSFLQTKETQTREFRIAMRLLAMRKQAKIIQQLTVNSLELANFPKLKIPMLFQTEHLAMQVKERELLFLPI